MAYKTYLSTLYYIDTYFICLFDKWYTFLIKLITKKNIKSLYNSASKVYIGKTYLSYVLVVRGHYDLLMQKGLQVLFLDQQIARSIRMYLGAPTEALHSVGAPRYYWPKYIL